MGKVRLADIAERIGVSTVTVHNALTGQKGVSGELRLSIQKMAQEMGYRSPSAARKEDRDKEHSAKNIGVLIGEQYLADYTTYYWKLYQEMALAASDKNCMTAVEILKYNMQQELILPRLAQEEAVDGLIIIGEISREYIRFLKKNIRMPLVFVDFYDKELAKDAVIADNFYGMYLLTEYLLERGFRRLAYVGSIYGTSSIMDRYCGFMKAILMHHAEHSPEWLVEDRDAMGHVQFELPEHLPEAFVCNCDLVAAILIQKLEEKGYRVPEDISVIGFDNFLYPGLPDRKITTYEISRKNMVKIALEKVLRQLRNPGYVPVLEVVSGHIVEKESVKPKA